MASTLLNELGLFTYDAYLDSFDRWVRQGESSSEHASHAYVEYTRLNWARTQRLHKTIQILPEINIAFERLSHSYSWIVLTEAWCGDSAQNLPVIAEIAKLHADKLKLFILLRDRNKELMSYYLTDGSQSIPKLIAIDDTISKEVFTWGPRPALAQEQFQEWKRNPSGRTWSEFELQLHTWYAKDKTTSIQREILNLISELESN